MFSVKKMLKQVLYQLSHVTSVFHVCREVTCRVVIISYVETKNLWGRCPTIFYRETIFPIAPTESALCLNTSVLRKSTRGLTFSHQQEAERLTRPKFCDDQSFTFCIL